jgi:hypothetical protein
LSACTEPNRYLLDRLTERPGAHLRCGLQRVGTFHLPPDRSPMQDNRIAASSLVPSRICSDGNCSGEYRPKGRTAPPGLRVLMQERVKLPFQLGADEIGAAVVPPGG